MPPLLLFIGMNLAAFLFALVVAARFQGSRGLARFGLAFTTAWLILTHSAVLACGLLGVLTPLAVLGFVSVAASLAVLLWRSALRGGIGDERVSANGPLSLAECFTGGVIVALAGLWAIRLMWLPKGGFEWDDQAYHALYPTIWLLKQHIGLDAVYNLKAYYPQSAGLLAVWYAVPWAGSSMAGYAWSDLTGVWYAALFAFGSADLLSKLGVRRGAWMLPVGLFLASPAIYYHTISFADVDLAVAVALFGALVFVVPHVAETDDLRRVRNDLIFAAWLSGLAVGIKPTAALPAGLIFAAALIRVRRVTGWHLVPALAFVGVGCGFVVGGYWYLRNILAMGNPLYPASIAGLPGASTFPETRLSEFAAKFGMSATLKQGMFAYLDFPWPFGLAWLLGLASGVIVLVRNRRGLSLPYGLWFGVVTVLAMATILSLPFQPFSAGWWRSLQSGEVHGLSYRYVMSLACFGWATIGISIGRFIPATMARWATLLAVAVAGVAICPTSRFLVLYVAVAAASGVAIVCWSRFCGRASAVFTQRPCLVLGTAITFLVAFVVWRTPARIQQAYASETAGVFGVLDTEPPGGTWAFSTDGNHRILALMGARFQHTPIPVDANGHRTDQPTFETDLMGQLTPMPNVTPQEFTENLCESGITLVLTYDLLAPYGPENPFAELLAKSGHAVILAKDERFTLWRLEPRK